MAVNGRVISIKSVADMLMQNPMMKDISWEFIISHAVECMRIVGTAPMFISEQEVVEIKHYKGALPVNVIDVDSILRVTDSGQMIPMISNEDTLSDHYSSYPSAAPTEVGDKYSLNNSKIFTNFEKGKVLIVYKTIATDEECYPLIPDNPEFVRALRAYIRYQWFDILNDMDKISAQKLNKAETDYMFYVGQAQANLQMPSEDEMEALVNSITQILPNRTQHADRFQFLGNQEFLKIHS